MHVGQIPDAFRIRGQGPGGVVGHYTLALTAPNGLMHEVVRAAAGLRFVISCAVSRLWLQN